MTEVFEYTVPLWHPIVVHFPVALLATAALASVVGVVHRTAFWRSVAVLLLGLGSAGAALAFFSGEAMEEQAEGVPIVDKLVELHEDMGRLTLIAAVLAWVGSSVVAYLVRDSTARQGSPLWARLVVAALALVAAGLALWTGHIGGTMVWGVPR